MPRAAGHSVIFLHAGKVHMGTHAACTCPCHGSHHGNSLLVKAHGKHSDLFPACTVRQIAQVKLGWDWALENPCLPIQETQEMKV